MKRSHLFALSIVMLMLLAGCSFSGESRSSSYVSGYSTTPATTASTRSPEEVLDEWRADVINNSVSVTYDALARSTDAMEGSCIKVTGEIQQVLEYDTLYQGLISITYYDDPYFPYYTDNVFFTAPKKYFEVRLLEGDIVTFYGISEGLFTYISVMNLQTTLPSMSVVEVDFN